MARIRLYRGAAGASLPSTKRDGAIYILEKDDVNNYGEMYVDMDNGKRVRIAPEHTVKYDKATVNTKTFTGTGVRLVTGNIPVPTSASFTGSAATITTTGTPSGTVSQPTFTGTKKTGLTVSPAASGTVTYTPAGSVSTPTISVATAGSTTTIKNPTKQTVAKTVVVAAPAATAPANNLTYYNYDSSTETLSLYQIGYTTGDSISTSNVTVKTGDASYASSQPTFTGTGKRLIVEDYTPSGTVSQPTFTGNSLSSTGNYTPTGSIGLTNTNKNTTVSAAASGAVTYTPTGSINVTLTQTETNATVNYS